MISELAGAIVASFEKDDPVGVKPVPPDFNDAIDGYYDLKNAVRAMLEALRHPTEKVREIMCGHASNGMVNWEDYHNAMIDAADL